MTKRIGVLHGMETTFPEALVHRLNQRYGAEGIVAEPVQIGAVRHDQSCPWDVILDRISHEVPFYRSYLKLAALGGTRVVNNPFWWSADDKFIDNAIATAVGVAVPRTVLLPHKERPPRTEAASFRNLIFPLDWGAIFSWVGFPAFLKPFDGGGWRGVTKVSSPDEFFAAFDASGQQCMMLQEAIEFEAYFRCYCVGREKVRIMRYNPAAGYGGAYRDVPTEPPDPALAAKIERDVLALCRALGYDLNTVEFAVRGGVPYAIDFCNPAPDADRKSVGEENFAWVVEAAARMLVRKAKAHEPGRNNTVWGGFVQDAVKTSPTPTALKKKK